MRAENVLGLQRVSLSSLEGITESPEEIEKLWIAEAERRFQELRDDVVQGIPTREIFAELRKKKV